MQAEQRALLFTIAAMRGRPNVMHEVTINSMNLNIPATSSPDAILDRALGQFRLIELVVTAPVRIEDGGKAAQSGSVAATATEILSGSFRDEVHARCTEHRC